MGLPLLLWLGGSYAHAQLLHLLVSPWDKLVHVAVFATLTCAIGIASGRRGRAALAIGFVGAMLVGLADEGLQLLDPSRAADIDDLLANAAGGLLGVAALAMRWQRQQVHDDL